MRSRKFRWLGYCSLVFVKRVTFHYHSFNVFDMLKIVRPLPRIHIRNLQQKNPTTIENAYSTTKNSSWSYVYFVFRGSGGTTAPSFTLEEGFRRREEARRPVGESGKAAPDDGVGVAGDLEEWERLEEEGTVAADSRGAPLG